MYQEWMDGIPILVSGCHEHNIEQFKKARDYYMNNKNYEMAEYYNKSINNETKLLREELNKPSKIKQILNIILN